MEKLANIEAQRGPLADTSEEAAKLDRERETQDNKLGEIQGKLAEMESDKAESRKPMSFHAHKGTVSTATSTSVLR